VNKENFNDRYKLKFKKMKSKQTLPSSIRKYIRKEKSRIRKEFIDVNEQETKIKELLAVYNKKR
jgi:hypothetical protein